MNALKHMELIFGVVLLVACGFAFLPGQPVGSAQPDALREPVAVVVIKGKRMTALEKRQSLGADASARPENNGS